MNIKMTQASLDAIRNFENVATEVAVNEKLKREYKAAKLALVKRIAYLESRLALKNRKDIIT